LRLAEGIRFRSIGKARLKRKTGKSQEIGVFYFLTFSGFSFKVALTQRYDGKPRGGD
jgi:hypothetical protein